MTVPDFPWPWPWPDWEPNPKPVKAYVRYEDGSLGSITVTGGKVPDLARPGRLIPVEEFNRLTTAMTEAHTARLDAMAAEDAERQVREFRDLRAAGIREETARRLSGYEGPADASPTNTA